MEDIDMENYIVINGVRHDLMKREGVKCQECSLFSCCTYSMMPCVFFAQYDWDTIAEIYFVLHSNS